MSFVPSRPFSFPRLSCIALLVAGIGLASCGGDDGDNPPAVKQADQVGTLHGVLAAALQEELGIGAPLTNLSTPVDALQDIVILSDPNGIRDDHPALPLMKNAFYAGRAVVLENVDAKEVNALIKALGVRISAFSLPEGAEFVELFAVRKVKNDTWFFVDVGTKQQRAASASQGQDGSDQDKAHDTCGKDYDVWIDVCGSSQTAAGGDDAHQQAQCEAATQALGATTALGPTLAKAMQVGKGLGEGAQDDNSQNKESNYEKSCLHPEAPCELTRSRGLLDWAQAGRKEAAKPPQSVVVAGGNNDIRNMVSRHYWQMSYSPGCRTFTTKYDIYSYHSFAEDMDYYYIRQYGEFTPGACWENNAAYCNACEDCLSGIEGHQRGYVRYYRFNHLLVENPWWKEEKYRFPENYKVVFAHTPGSADTSQPVPIQTNTFVGEAIGFEGAGGTALSSGISTYTNEIETYPDTSVTYSVYGDERDGGGFAMEWQYDFLRPCGAASYESCTLFSLTGKHVYDNYNLLDATALAKGTFKPWLEWTLRVPSEYSLDYLGEEKAQTGISTFVDIEDGASWGRKTDSRGWSSINNLPVRHECQSFMFSQWYVPLQRPPLLAANQDALEVFPAVGGSQTVNLASKYDWKVYEKPDWVQVDPQYGDSTQRKGSYYPGWGGSIELRVTARLQDVIIDESPRRSGTVKICATDSDGSCTKGGEEMWFNVTQGPLSN